MPIWRRNGVPEGNVSRSAANASRAHGSGARLKYSARPLAARTSFTTFGSNNSSAWTIGVARVAIGASSPASACATARMPAAGANGSSPCRFTTMLSSAPAVMQRTLGQAVAARGMVAARHADVDSGLPGQCRGDARVVHCHHDLAGTGLQRTPRHPHDHRHATDLAQRLARQAGGAVARGNGDDERQVRLATWSFLEWVTEAGCHDTTTATKRISRHRCNAKPQPLARPRKPGNEVATWRQSSIRTGPPASSPATAKLMAMR